MVSIAETIFLAHIGIMKSVLDLGEYGFRGDERAWKYFKKQTMDAFYLGLRQSFVELERSKILKRCSCNSNLRHGWTDCGFCHGAGWVNNN